MEDVNARIRVPPGRSVRSVSLMRAQQDLPVKVRGGWLEVIVPSLLIHEAIKVDWS